MKVLQLARRNYLLLTILIIAAVLRFVAVAPGYNPYHGDETAIWGSALLMVKNSTLDPGRYDYPATAIMINALFHKTLFIPVSWGWYYLTQIGSVIDGVVSLTPTELEQDRIFDLHIAGERGVNAIFWARLVTAMFGVGTVFLTYVLSIKLFTRRVGLLAALFLAFNYRNVVNSHIGLPDIYNSFFVLLSLIVVWNLWEKPSRLTYYLAGITTGFAFAIKYQVFAVLPFVFIHFALAFKDKIQVKTLFNIRFITAGLFIPLVFMLTNPYFFIRLDTVLGKMNEEFLKYGMGTNSLNIYPLSYFYHIDYGPVQFALVVLGVFLGLTKKPLRSIFLLSVVIPAFFVFLYYSRGGFYVRNFITTTPILLIFASVAAWQIADPIIKRFSYKASILILTPALLVIMYVPAKNSILSSYGYTLPWGYDALRPWIQENLPSDVVVAAHPFDKANLAIKNVTTEFSPSESYALAEHIENMNSYVIVDLNWASIPFYFWMSYGVDEARELWGKPMNIVRNTFHGLAAEELFRYQVHTSTKPWQSPDTHFVVVQVPKWPEVKMELLKSFAYGQDEEGWEVYGAWKEAEMKRYGYDPEFGRTLKGSLVFVPGAVRFPTVRIATQPIEAKPGHLYKVSGFLRTERMLGSKEREGFIRLDFYSEYPDLEEVGVQASVSSRVYGTNEWVIKEILDRAPDEAKYLVVSFQTYSSTVSKIWLDDLTIEESVDEVVDITSSSPYTKDYVDLNYLYPNSHGNL